MRRLVFLVLGVLACDGVGGPPVGLVLVGRSLHGKVADTVPVDVRVLDRDDGVVGGVRLRATTSGGHLASDTVVSDDVGVGHFVWVLDTVAGSQVIDVVIDRSDVRERFSVEAASDTAVGGRFTQDYIVVTGAREIQLPVDARDRWGNQVLNPLIVPVDVQTIVDSTRWSASIMGAVHFRLIVTDPDTMLVDVHPPLGPYRSSFRVEDTVWVETGRFVPDTIDPGTVCTVPDDARDVATYAAVDVLQIRTIGAGMPDTVRADTVHGAVVHVVRANGDVYGGRAMRYHQMDRPGPSTCDGTLFVRPWRFGTLPNFADSLRIDPN